MVSSPIVLILTVSCAFTFGLIVVLLVCMRVHLADHLQINRQRAGGLWAAMNFFLVPLSAVAGLWIDLGDVRWVIIVGSAATCLALLMLRSRHGLFGFLLTSLGGACLSTSAIVLMPRAFFGENEAAASLNMGHVFFALGALLAPTLADVLLRALGLKRTLTLLALGCMVPGILAVLTPTHEVPAGQESNLLALLHDPLIWIATAFFFLYAPIEGCLHSWATTYLRKVGHGEKSVQRLIAGFWTAFLAARLVTAYLQHARWLPAGTERWTLFALAVLSTVMIGNLLGTAYRENAGRGFLALGFFLGPIFPTLIGVLFHFYAGDQHTVQGGAGAVYGLVFLLGSAGSLFFGPWISARAEGASAQEALRAPLGLGILLMVVAALFALWTI